MDFEIESGVIIKYTGEGENVVIPEGTTTIGDHAFYGCKILTSLTFPDSLEEVGEAAFFNCQNLETINFGKNMKTIGEMAFGNCHALRELILPEGIVKVERSAFSPCYGLTKLVLPESLKELSGFAFSNCRELTEIEFPEGMSFIDSSAFSMCKSLVSVTLPKSLKAISRALFLGCSSLKEINVNPELEEVDNEAFSGCDKLIRLNVPEKNPYLKDIDGVLFSKDEETLMYFPGGRLEIKIRDGVKQIGKAAFYGNRNFDRITLPESLERIGDAAFYRCTELVKLDLPEGLKEIGKQSFDGCSKLEYLFIPDGVKVVGETTFRGCRALMWLRLPEDLPFDVHWFCTPNDPPAFSADHTVMPFATTRKFEEVTSNLGLRRASLGMIMAENSGVRVEKEVADGYAGYIKENIAGYYEAAVSDDGILSWLTGRQMIPADDIEKLLEMAADSGRASASALLLDYQNKMQGEALSEKIEKSTLNSREQMKERFSALESALDDL